MLLLISREVGNFAMWQLDYRYVTQSTLQVLSCNIVITDILKQQTSVESQISRDGRSLALEVGVILADISPGRRMSAPCVRQQLPTTSRMQTRTSCDQSCDRCLLMQPRH